MIFAQHGSRRAPHVFFDVLDEERYSETLDRHFVHRVLRIGYNYKGLTEIGGLVVLPEFRRHPERLGRLLVSRALPVHRAPPRRVPRRGAVRADAAARSRRHQPAVGGAGAALHRASATRRPIGCRRRTRSSSARCFPRTRIYATLLPAHVQAADRRRSGPSTKAVEKMLREIGFSYAHRIDPFDGGPHFHARTDDITLVRATPRGARRGARRRRAGDAPRRTVLVARERPAPPVFRGARARRVGGRLADAARARAELAGARARGRGPATHCGVASGDEIAYLRLA